MKRQSLCSISVSPALDAGVQDRKPKRVFWFFRCKLLAARKTTAFWPNSDLREAGGLCPARSFHYWAITGLIIRAEGVGEAGGDPELGLLTVALYLDDALHEHVYRVIDQGGAGGVTFSST
jgi:hypothetical protein